MRATFLVAAGLFGIIVGSFLNVVIWRVPRRESIVRPRSSCPGCGHEIRARDNVPVLSWLLLRGRCRDCSGPISARYPLVELLTGVVFAATTAFSVFGSLGFTALPAFLFFGAVAVALAFIDLDTHRLPDVIVVPSIVVSLGLLSASALVDHEPQRISRALLGAGILFSAYLVLWIIYPSGMGLGDVKLAAVLGMYMGWIGWGTLIVGGFAAFLLGGAYAVGLLATGRANRKSGIPFGPWMVVGAATGFAVGESVWQGYLALVT